MNFNDYWKDLSGGVTYDYPAEAAKCVWDDMKEQIHDLQEICDKQAVHAKKMNKILCEVLELVRKDTYDYGESDNLTFAIGLIKDGLKQNFKSNR